MSFERITIVCALVQRDVSEREQERRFVEHEQEIKLVRIPFLQFYLHTQTLLLHICMSCV